MRLEDLQQFLVIADTRNLHRAAERTGLTQSALTKSVRRLEDELGVRLFDRAPRGLELTDVGEAFAKRIGVMNLELKEALRELGEWRTSTVGVIRMGTTPPIFDTILAPAIQQFLRHRPGVRFELSVHTTAPVLELLLNGTLDLVTAVLSPTIPDGLETEIVCEQKMHFVVRKGHPLLDVPGARTADLREVRWLLEPNGRMKRQWVESHLAAAGLPPPLISIEADASASVIASLLPHGDLATLLNLTSLQSMIGTQLVVRDDILPPLVRPLAIYWRRNAYISPVVEDFKTMLQRACAVSQSNALASETTP